ncbi:MAG: porin family protein [Gammaproteobacteria bacterium]|nr:porin family protein [Gammaproteobacteria bacterium]
MLHNKILIGVVILMAGQSVFAAKNSLADYKSGFYLGAQAGYASTGYGSGPEDYMSQEHGGTKNISKSDFGGRLFVGYSFIPYFSLESGWTYYPRNKYLGYDYCTLTTGFNTIDLMAKAILPLERLSPQFVGWNVYGKLGAAITVMKDGATNKKDDKKVIVLPAYGLGVGYNFTDHIGVDLSWFGVYSSKNVKVRLDGDTSNTMYIKPHGNIVALGLTYKF